MFCVQYYITYFQAQRIQESCITEPFLTIGISYSCDVVVLAIANDIYVVLSS